MPHKSLSKQLIISSMCWLAAKETKPTLLPCLFLALTKLLPEIETKISRWLLIPTAMGSHIHQKSTFAYHHILHFENQQLIGWNMQCLFWRLTFEGYLTTIKCLSCCQVNIDMTKWRKKTSGKWVMFHAKIRFILHSKNSYPLTNIFHCLHIHKQSIATNHMNNNITWQDPKAGIYTETFTASNFRFSMKGSVTSIWPIVILKFIFCLQCKFKLIKRVHFQKGIVRNGIRG